MKHPKPPPSQRPLSGQNALVTGANSGIGAGISRRLAAAGAAVVINYHSDEPAAQALVAEIEGEGGRAVAILADVGVESDVREMFARAIAELGTLDILVSNAGIQQDAAFVDMTLAQWNAVLAVNLTGGFLCAQAAAREFLRRGPRPEVSRALGKIVFVSSVHEVIPWAGHVNYATSKGGMMQLMKSTAQELAPRGIRVNSVAPGAIRTPINHDAWATPEAAARLVKLIPCGRIGEPEDIADAVAWLVSDESDYVHGTTLFVDGGMTLYPSGDGG